MEGHNLIAIYGSRTDAERARDRLIQSGIPDIDVRISAADLPGGTSYAAGRTEAAAPVTGERREGFWDWLFGRDIPEEHRGWYETNLRQGRTALSVLVRNEAQRPFIEEILDQFAPLEFEDEGVTASAMQTGGMRETASRPLPDTGLSRESTLGAGTLGAGTRASGEIAGEAARFERTGESEDQVIPVVKEELSVGKRASERRYRIRTYVVERPVENEVTLRDERVIVERRPVAGERALGGAEMPQQREFEVIERHEEPVVEKRARNVEEVVVHKEASQRTETVRDTVRETRVDVDNGSGTATENLEGTLPADRAYPADRKP